MLTSHFRRTLRRFAMVPRHYRFVSSHSSEPDPFDVLGVNRASSLKDVRDRYHQLAKELHPDASGEKDSVTLEKNREQFTNVTNAFRQCYAWAQVAENNRKNRRRSTSEVDGVNQIIADMERLQTVDLDGVEYATGGPDWGGYWYDYRWMTAFGDEQTAKTPTTNVKAGKPKYKKRYANAAFNGNANCDQRPESMEDGYPSTWNSEADPATGRSKASLKTQEPRVHPTKEQQQKSWDDESPHS